MFSHEGASQTYESVLETSRNSGIHQSSVGRIIPLSFQSHPPRGKQPAYFANFSWVATQLNWGEKLCTPLEAAC